MCELEPIFVSLRGQTFWVYSLKLSFVYEEASWLARGDFVVYRGFTVHTQSGLLCFRGFELAEILQGFHHVQWVFIRFSVYG